MVQTTTTFICNPLHNWFPVVVHQPVLPFVVEANPDEATGPKGDKGEKGEQAPRGEKGEKGEKGDKGNKGDPNQ